MHGHTSLFYGDVFLVLDLSGPFSFLQYFMVLIPFLGGCLSKWHEHIYYHINKWEMSVMYCQM